MPSIFCAPIPRATSTAPNCISMAASMCDAPQTCHGLYLGFRMTGNGGFQREGRVT
jgi:hypothetical protein